MIRLSKLADAYVYLKVYIRTYFNVNWTYTLKETKGGAELGDDLGEGVVADELGAPDLVDELGLGDEFARRESEDDEHIHGSGAQADLPTVLNDPVEGWFHHPVPQVERPALSAFHIVSARAFEKSIDFP